MFRSYEDLLQQLNKTSKNMGSTKQEFQKLMRAYAIARSHGGTVLVLYSSLPSLLSLLF